MFENRSLQLDLVALALLGLVIFLGVSLISYDPADPVGELIRPFERLYQQDLIVYPQADTVTNACGWWGAFCSDVLLTCLGVGAYYLVASLAIVDGLLLARRKIDMVPLRLVGWFGSLFGLSTIVALLAPDGSPGPMTGAAGYLGMFGHGVLQMHFASAGTLIIALSFLLGGLMLCTDYLLFRAAISALGYTAKAAGSARVRLPRPAARRKTDVQDQVPLSNQSDMSAVDGLENGKPSETTADTPAGLSVKVRGKSIEAAAEGEEGIEGEPDVEDEGFDEEWDDEWEEEEDDVDEDIYRNRSRRRSQRPARTGEPRHFTATLSRQASF